VLRVTVDTNISALNFSGNPARILDMAESGENRLAISDDILVEVERLLIRPKFGWTPDQVDDAIQGGVRIHRTCGAQAADRRCSPQHSPFTH
jgi:hypothetical protein